MVLNDIIEDLFRTGKIKRFLDNYKLSVNDNSDRELKKDLEAEILLVLLVYPDVDKIAEMRGKTSFDKFVMKIIKNQVCSTKSPFYQKYKKWNNRIEYGFDRIEDRIQED